MAGLLALVATLGLRLACAESAPLALDIYTADPAGIGVTSTLIYGPREAILVDTQFRISDAEKLADLIAARGRHLKAILVTHPHFDHYFGAAVLLKRFPGTPVYSSPAGVAFIKATLASTIPRIQADFGAAAIPTDIPIPQVFPDTHFTVDGQAVDVTPDVQGDVGPRPGNSYVWVPSLAAAIVGDIVFNQAHLSMRATTTQTRKEWQQSLRTLQALHPRVVVAGHKSNAALADSPDALAFNEAYIADFDASVAVAHNATELVTAMKAKYPQVGLDRILINTSKVLFPN